MLILGCLILERSLASVYVGFGQSDSRFVDGHSFYLLDIEDHSFDFHAVARFGDTA